jgi:hypothetical protein
MDERTSEPEAPMRAPVVVCCWCAALVACGPPKACVDRAAAYRAIQPLILPELSDPGRAAFPDLAQINLTPVNDCRFLFAGYVDTRNEAGREVRVFYRAMLRFAPQTGRYEKISLEFSSG